jgi:hypothetical protein
MSATPAARPTSHAQDLRMLEVLLTRCVPGALGRDQGTAEHVRAALRAGDDVAELMLCLPGETDAVAALRFARTALDWWDHRLVGHDRVLAAVG